MSQKKNIKKNRKKAAAAAGNSAPSTIEQVTPFDPAKKLKQVQEIM